MSNKMENQVMVVRLTSGELLIGRMTINPNDKMIATMVNVMRLHEMPPTNQGDTGNLAMLPFLPFTKAGTDVTGDNKLEVFLSNIQYMSEPVEQIAAKYEEVFNPSKIIKPTGDEIGAIMNQPIGDIAKGE